MTEFTHRKSKWAVLLVLIVGGALGGSQVNGAANPKAGKIAFEADPNLDDDLEIYAMDADGFNLVQLIASPGPDINPTFSPDGRQIAWWRQGIGDIWIMNADGGGKEHVTKTPLIFEGFPAWHQGNLQ